MRFLNRSERCCGARFVDAEAEVEFAFVSIVCRCCFLHFGPSRVVQPKPKPELELEFDLYTSSNAALLCHLMGTFFRFEFCSLTSSLSSQYRVRLLVEVARNLFSINMEKVI